MSEERKNTQSGFRIKWADKEIEYYGDSVQAIFEEVFGHIKNLPTQGSTASHSLTSQQQEPQPPRSEAPTAEGIEYERIARDLDTSKDLARKVIELRSDSKFNTLVPFLVKKPKDAEEAILLITYALQVGIQQKSIEPSYMKRLLRGPNGIPLPGREFGLALQALRGKHFVDASQAEKGRYKPFWLNDDGLKEARKQIKAKTTEK
jgi:hypothetical protein